MVDAMGTYHTEAAAAARLLVCADNDCDRDGDDEHEHTGDEAFTAAAHATLAAAAASIFQGLAALEAAGRTTR